MERVSAIYFNRDYPFQGGLTNVYRREWGRCNGQAPQSTKSFMAPAPSAFQPFAQSDRPLDGVTFFLPIQIQLAASATK
jgi:hypothetical protein